MAMVEDKGVKRSLGPSVKDDLADFLSIEFIQLQSMAITMDFTVYHALYVLLTPTPTPSTMYFADKQTLNIFLISQNSWTKEPLTVHRHPN